MARDYIIIKHSGGAFLRIRGEGTADESIELHAASQEGMIREAESVINERFYSLNPFPGFHWVSNKTGFFTTDHDLH